MKTTINLEFGEDDIEERNDLLRKINSTSPELIVTELDQYLRGIIKYSEKSEEAKEMAEETRTKMREFNEHYGCGVQF